MHTVVSGEYLSLIAQNYGVPSWEDIYYHANNASFREFQVYLLAIRRTPSPTSDRPTHTWRACCSPIAEAGAPSSRRRRWPR